MGNISNVSQDVEKLQFNINETVGKVTILNSVLGDLKRALPFDEIRKIDVAYGNLTRSLVANAREVQNLKKEVEALSKTTLYYGKDVLVTMATQLKSSTSALAAFGKANQDLANIFVNTYKRDAPEYLRIFDQLNQRLPNLTTRMQSASTSTSTLFEVFKTAGPQGISAYLTAIGKMESETKDAVDSLDDYFNKFFNNLKNNAISTGEQFSKNLTGSVGADTLSNVVFGLGAAGAVGGIGKYSTGIADMSYEGKYGGLKTLGARSLSALPGALAGGALAYGFSNPQDMLQAGIGLGGASLAGYSAGSVFGQKAGIATGLIAVTIEGFSQAALGSLSSVVDVYSQSPGADSEVTKRIQDRMTAYNAKRGFLDRAGDVAHDAFGDVANFFGFDVSESLGREAQANIAREEINRKADEDRRVRQRENLLFNTQKFDSEQFAISRMNISDREKESKMADLLQRQMEFLDTSSKRSDLSASEFGRLSAQRMIARQNVSGLRERESLFSSIGLAGAEAQLGFLGSTNIGALSRGVGIGDAQGAIAGRMGELDSLQKFYGPLKDTLEGAKKLQEIEAERFKLRERSMQLDAIEVQSKQKLVEFSQSELKSVEARKRAEGASVEEITLTQTGQLEYIQQTIKLKQEERLITKNTNEQLRLGVEIEQLRSVAAAKTREIAERQLAIKQSDIQTTQSVRGLLGSVGPEGEIRNLQENISILREREKVADDVSKREIQNQIRLAEEQQKVLEQFTLPTRQLERQNTLVSQQVQLYQTLRAPVTAIAQLKREELSILQNQLQLTVQQRNAAIAGGASEEQVFQFDQKVGQLRQQIAQSIDFQRRSVAEQFTEQMINMPSGSYLNPNISQGGLLGSGYYTGISQGGGGNRGSYQRQIANMFGEGFDERSPWEQLFNLLQNEGLGIQGELTIRDDGTGELSAQTAKQAAK